MNNMTDDVSTDMAALGREVVADGRIAVLRTRLGWSFNAMAEAIGTSAVTYSTWERNPQTRLWPATAHRIGVFYSRATQELREIGSIDELIPFYKVAMLLGVPQELLMRRYRHGEFDGEDLGVLGMWLYRSDLNEMTGRS